MKHAVRWDDFLEGAQYATRPNHVMSLKPLSHTRACTCEECYQMRDTDKTEENVRGTKCPVFTSKSLTKFRYCLLAKLLENLRMRKNLAKWVPHRFCKAFAASTLSATCDLAIGDLGVDAIESLDVRVATNFVKVMKRKKVARNRSSNVDSSIPILLAMLHRMVLASISRSSE